MLATKKLSSMKIHAAIKLHYSQAIKLTANLDSLKNLTKNPILNATNLNIVLWKPDLEIKVYKFKSLF